MSNLKTKIINKQLKKMGYDVSDPKGVTFRAVDSLVNTAVNNGFISKAEMTKFLNGLINKL